MLKDKVMASALQKLSLQSNFPVQTEWQEEQSTELVCTIFFINRQLATGQLYWNKPKMSQFCALWATFTLFWQEPSHFQSPFVYSTPQHRLAHMHTPWQTRAKTRDTLTLAVYLADQPISLMSQRWHTAEVGGLRSWWLSELHAVLVSPAQQQVKNSNVRVAVYTQLCSHNHSYC